MHAVQIKDKYVETLNSFGDLQQVVDLALQRYTIEQITTKIHQLRKKNAVYRQKYGCSYSDFHRKISEDESFVEHVEQTTCKTWEIDLAEWEFCDKGIEDWTRKLHDILQI